MNEYKSCTLTKFKLQNAKTKLAYAFYQKWFNSSMNQSSWFEQLMQPCRVGFAGGQGFRPQLFY